jgi:hypothetical protein
MPRAIEKLMLHPAQYTENAECDITRFIMVTEYAIFYSF